MQNLDDIFYEAIIADEALVAVVGGRVTSTCVPIPPDQQDTTDLPYLIITDDPFTNDMATKDDEWESDVDKVQAGITINAESPAEVKRIRNMVRKAISEYVKAMEEPPTLIALTNEGVQWDWQKPCYFDILHYQCEINLYDDED